MLKYILSIFTLFLLFGCSEKTSNDSSKHLSILRAPIGAEPISTYSRLTLGFSSEIDMNTVNKKTIYLQEITQADTVEAKITLGDDNTTLIFTPNTYLRDATTYKLTVTTDVRSRDDKVLNENFTFTFMTASDSQNPNTPFIPIDASPYDLSVFGVSTITDITLAFNRNIAPSDKAIFSVIDTNTSQEVNGTFEYFNSRVRFIPDHNLTLGDRYDVNMTNTPIDMYGTSYDSTVALGWSFNVNLEYNTTGYELNTSLSYDINHSAYMMNGLFDASYNDFYLVVASDNALEFFLVDANTLQIIKKENFTIALSSKVTDMKFDDANILLMVSTMSDGVFSLSLDSNATKVNIVNFAKNTPNIYGAVKQANKYYVVSPDFGLNIYDDANLSLTQSIATDGTALKICTNNSDSLYIADYENGILEYNTTSQNMRRFDLNITVKDVGCYDLEIVGASVAGNLYITDTATGSILDIGSLKSSKIDAFIFTATSMMYIAKGSVFNFNFMVSKENSTLISAMAVGSLMFTLDSTGIIDVFKDLSGNTALVAQ